MNITFVLPDTCKKVSGGNIYNRNLIGALSGKGINTTVYSFSSEDSNESSLAFSQHLIKDPTSWFLIIDSLLYFSLYPYLKELSQKYAVIPLIHMPPEIIQEQNEIDWFYSNSYEGIFDHCRHIFVTSQHVKEYYIKKGVRGESISVLRPSLSIEFQKQEYSPKPLNLLNVGNIAAGKDQLLLVKTLAELKEYSWNLKIAGDYEPEGSYFKEVKDVILKNGLGKRIIFMGSLEQDQLEKLYSGADLLISTSKYESFGMNLQDAVCGGLPVLTSDVGGQREAVPDYGGIFYSPDNELNLRRELVKLFSDENYYKKLVFNLRQKPVKPDSWNMVARRFIGSLEKME